MKILVLFDQLSEEGLPSKMTKEHAIESLIKKGFNVLELQFDIKTIYADLLEIKPDVVFNAMHGKIGEDGRLQSLLDIMKIKYTHDNHFISSIGFNKNYTKSLMESVGVPVANGILLNRNDILSGEYLQNDLTKKDYIIKPNCNGSTLGLCIRAGEKHSLQITENDLSSDEEFLLEEFIPGREFSVLFYNKQIIGAIELVSNGTENIISYNDKYIDICDRQKRSIEDEILNKLYAYSLSFINKINANALARIDFRGNNDKIVALEVNTHPGLGKKSMVANIYNNSKLNMDDLFQNLVLNAKYNAY
jgi:D-alanine-D-alanine ligase